MDPEFSLITQPVQEKTEVYFQRDVRALSNSSDSSDPWVKKVTDFHFSNIRDTKHKMRMGIFPVQNDDRK